MEGGISGVEEGGGVFVLWLCNRRDLGGVRFSGLWQEAVLRTLHMWYPRNNKTGSGVTQVDGTRRTKRKKRSVGRWSRAPHNTQNYFINKNATKN